MATPTAQEERVEVGAIKGEYQFGFHDQDQSVFRAKKGLDREIVEQISDMKGEPHWMRDYRLQALDIFFQKPMPSWGGHVEAIDFDDIYYYVKPASARVVPGKMCRKTLKKPLIAWVSQRLNTSFWLALGPSTTRKWFIIA